MDRLERYIQENLTFFNDKEPSKRVWKNLDEALGDPLAGAVLSNIKSFSDKTPKTANWQKIREACDDPLAGAVLSNFNAFNKKEPPQKLWDKIKEAQQDPLTCAVLSDLKTFNDKEPESSLWEGISDKLDKKKFDAFAESKGNVFDDKEAPGGLWDKISSELDTAEEGSEETEAVQETPNRTPAKEVKMVPISWLWNMAASFALLLTSLFVYQSYFAENSSNGSLADVSVSTISKENIEKVSNNYPELAETESRYVSLISTSQKQIRYFEKEGYSLGKENDFYTDLNALDQQYKQLKSELISGVNNDQIAAAMIQNLQIRMNLLNQQLEILKQISNKQKIKENEGVNI